MKLHLYDTTQSNLIQSCTRTEQGFSVKINDQIYHRSIVVSTNGIDNLDIQSFEQLSKQHFQQFSQQSPEVIILGTGQNILFPCKSLTTPLIEQSIGLEVMNNDAACRTYNLLLSDGRNATLVLLM